MANTVYHRGGNISWGDYLILDYQRDQSARLRNQQQFLKDAYAQQSSQLQATIASIGSLEEALRDGVAEVVDSIESLHASFDYHLGLVVSQLQTQNARLAQIGHELLSISETVQNPTLNLAREQKNIGFRMKKVGLVQEALDAFLKAESYENKDFVLQLEIGLLQLYGHTPDCSVVNVEAATRHLLSAAKLSHAFIGIIPGAAEYCGQAFLHASIAKYVLANERFAEGDAAGAQLLTESALQLARNAVETHPSLDYAHFHLAKYAALLKRPDEMTAAFVRAVELDMNYTLKVFGDPDFVHYWPDLERTILQMAAEALASAREVQTSLRRLQIELSDWGGSRGSLAAVQELLVKVETAISAGGYMDLTRALQASRGEQIGRVEQELAKRRDDLDKERRSLIDQLAWVLKQLDEDHRKRARDNTRYQAWLALWKQGAANGADHGVEAIQFGVKLREAVGAAREEVERVEENLRSSFESAISVSRLLAVVLPLGLAYILGQAYTVPVLSSQHFIGFSKMLGGLMAPSVGIFMGLLMASLVRHYFDHEFEVGAVLSTTAVASIVFPFAYLLAGLIVAVVMELSSAKDDSNPVSYALLVIGLVITWIPGFAKFCGKAIFRRNR